MLHLILGNQLQMNQYYFICLRFNKFLFFCSSMYFDEDGDLAHEFYEETIVTKNGQRKVKLKRIYKNLTPQVRMA